MSECIFRIFTAQNWGSGSEARVTRLSHRPVARVRCCAHGGTVRSTVQSWIQSWHEGRPSTQPSSIRGKSTGAHHLTVAATRLQSSISSKGDVDFSFSHLYRCQLIQSKPLWSLLPSGVPFETPSSAWAAAQSWQCHHGWRWAAWAAPTPSVSAAAAAADLALCHGRCAHTAKRFNNKQNISGNC